jgi:hypothetical protein
MQYKNLYLEFLPYALAPPLFIMTHDTLAIADDYSLTPLHKLYDIMGICSVGAFTALLYPITMPVCAIRYLYRNHLKRTL